MRGAPCRPSASTSQPACRRMWLRAAAMQVKLAGPPPVTKPTLQVGGSCRKSSSHCAAIRICRANPAEDDKTSREHRDFRKANHKGHEGNTKDTEERKRRSRSRAFRDGASPASTPSLH